MTDITRGSSGPNEYTLTIDSTSKRISDPIAIEALQAIPNSVITISTNTTLTSAHNGQILRCTAAVTLEYPDGLGSLFSCIVEPPSSGNVTIDPTGACAVNGGTASLTRSLTNNPAGFVIRALGANVAGVSGS